MGKIKLPIRTQVLALGVLIPVCFLLVIIGFITINKPVVVTFDTNAMNDRNFVGETVSNIKAGPGSKIKLPTPIRKGHEFIGWSTDIAGQNMVTKITSTNTHLIAQWREINPRAKFYVDGYLVREIDISNTGGGLNSAFVPVHSWSQILGAYDLETFRGWYYYDENNVRTELRTSNRGATWLTVKVSDTGEELSNHVLAQVNRFFPPHDVALNALWDNNAGKEVSIRYLLPNGENAILSGTGHSVTGRFGSHINALPQINHTEGAFVGWRLASGNDIFQSEQFYLDSSLFLTYPTEIRFIAVTMNTSFQAGSVYEKVSSTGGVTLNRIANFSGQTWSRVQIRDFSAYTSTVMFNFVGNAGNNVRYFTEDGVKHLTDEQKAMQKFASRKYAQINTSNVSGVVNLPLATDYAVAGKKFIGWKSNLDNNVYNAGMNYNIPRGTIGVVSFTAVWA